MTAGQAIKNCMKKYATFAGRAARPEYWWFFVFCAVLALVLLVMDAALFNTVSKSSQASAQENPTENVLYIPFTAAFLLAVALPLISAGWRRMHDTGRSGVHLLYPFIVGFGLYSFISYAGQGGDFAEIAVGLIVLVLAISPMIVFWWLSRPSQTSDNIYGPNPHEVSP